LVADFLQSPKNRCQAFDRHGSAPSTIDLPDDDRANQFDQFAPIHLARPALDGAKSPVPKRQFRERIQADLGQS
jgi:hypothetical protein